MANPQLENGHLRIAYEVWEHLMKAGLSGSELAIVMAAIRQTWGWKRKEANVSIIEFCELTKQPERTTARALASLVQRNMLIRSGGGGRGLKSKWALNKDWETWKLCQKCQSKKTLTKMAENLNSDKNGRDVMPKMAEFPVKNGRVSGRNSQEQIENEPPKTIFKERKKEKKVNSEEKTPPKMAENRSDEAYETWSAEFKQHRHVPYQKKNADFVHLAALRKALDLENKGTPQKWQQAIHNYFASPLSSYTLADLCQRYDCFINGRIDRFGKPEPTHEQTLYDYDESRQT